MSMFKPMNCPEYTERKLRKYIELREREVITDVELVNAVIDLMLYCQPLLTAEQLVHFIPAELHAKLKGFMFKVRQDNYTWEPGVGIGGTYVYRDWSVELRHIDQQLEAMSYG